VEGGRIPRDDSSGNLIDNPYGNLIDNPYGNLIDNPSGNLIDNPSGNLIDNFNTFTDTSTSGNFTNEANLQIHLILANAKPIVSLVFGQNQLDTLMDTGASISLIAGRAVRKFGLQTERGSTCTLEMAGGQKSTTDRWVSQSSIFQISEKCDLSHPDILAARSISINALRLLPRR